MVRRLIPLVAVVPLGVLVGLLFVSEEWSRSTRLLVTAGAAIAIVLVGTPFAMMRRRRVPYPPSPVFGQARLGSYELRGVYSENPVSPLGEERAEELASGLRSSAIALLPVVPRGLEFHDPRKEARERAIFVRVTTEEAVPPGNVPDDLVVWSSQPRRRALRWVAARVLLRLRSIERLRDGRSPTFPTARLAKQSIH